MSADDDHSDAEGDPKKSCNFLGRFILFLIEAPGVRARVRGDRFEAMIEDAHQGERECC